MNYYVFIIRIKDTLRPSSQHKGDLFASEAQRKSDMRQQEIGDKAKGKENKGEGIRVFILGGPAGSWTTSG